MATGSTNVPAEQRSYSIEEVGEVIRTASALARVGETPLTDVRDRLAFPELLEMARELGIPETLLRRAIPEAEEIRRRAARRTRRKMRFFRHLLTYAVVIGGFALLDLVATPDSLWFVWPATFWGVLVVMHGLRTFVTGKDGTLHRAVYRRELEAERRG